MWRVRGVGRHRRQVNHVALKKNLSCARALNAWVSFFLLYQNVFVRPRKIKKFLFKGHSWFTRVRVPDSTDDCETNFLAEKNLINRRWIRTSEISSSCLVERSLWVLVENTWQFSWYAFIWKLESNPTESIMSLQVENKISWTFKTLW